MAGCRSEGNAQRQQVLTGLAGLRRAPPQVQVEECFIKQSALKPRHTKLYWMGLATGELGAAWPNFTWIDKGNAVYNGDYQHWGAIVNASGARLGGARANARRRQLPAARRAITGTLLCCRGPESSSCTMPAAAGTFLEPNNVMPPENCAGANVSQPAGLQATGQKILDYRPDGAGLWEDRPCSERHEFICEVLQNAQYEPFTTSTGYTFKWVACVLPALVGRAAPSTLRYSL